MVVGSLGFVQDLFTGHQMGFQRPCGPADSRRTLARRIYIPEVRLLHAVFVRVVCQKVRPSCVALPVLLATVASCVQALLASSGDR